MERKLKWLVLVITHRVCTSRGSSPNLIPHQHKWRRTPKSSLVDFKLKMWANTIDPLVAEDFELRGSCLRWPAISQIQFPPHTLTGSGYSHRSNNLPPRSLLCHEQPQSQVAFFHAVELSAELGNYSCV